MTVPGAYRGGKVAPRKCVVKQHHAQAPVRLTEKIVIDKKAPIKVDGETVVLRFVASRHFSTNKEWEAARKDPGKAARRWCIAHAPARRFDFMDTFKFQEEKQGGKE